MKKENLDDLTDPEYKKKGKIQSLNNEFLAWISITERHYKTDQRQWMDKHFSVSANDR